MGFSLPGILCGINGLWGLGHCVVGVFRRAFLRVYNCCLLAFCRKIVQFHSILNGSIRALQGYDFGPWVDGTTGPPQARACERGLCGYDRVPESPMLHGP